MRSKTTIRQRRASLEALARENRLFCEKHRAKINVMTFYTKHCYVGRTNGRYSARTCPYLSVIKQYDLKC